MSPSIFLMLHADLFARPTTKSHIYIKNQTTDHLFKAKPLAIEFRLSKHSSNKKIFKGSIQIYQETLKKSGFDY